MAANTAKLNYVFRKIQEVAKLLPSTQKEALQPVVEQYRKMEADSKTINQELFMYGSAVQALGVVLVNYAQAHGGPTTAVRDPDEVALAGEKLLEAGLLPAAVEKPKAPKKTRKPRAPRKPKEPKFEVAPEETE